MTIFYFCIVEVTALFNSKLLNTVHYDKETMFILILIDNSWHRYSPTVDTKIMHILILTVLVDKLYIEGSPTG